MLARRALVASCRGETPGDDVRTLIGDPWEQRDATRTDKSVSLTRRLLVIEQLAECEFRVDER